MSGSGGTPYAPHTDSETAAMLSAIGVDDEEALFDIPDAVAFDGEFGIEPRSEREIRAECSRIFARNDDLAEFLGRGHYGHYVPSVVDHLADRAEFLTSYTQYQPEVSQGFLQALFEYQSMLVELTGLPVANCSMYDAATALGEAATLADRVRSTSGDVVLVPDHLREGKRAVLENYCAGADLTVESYPMTDGNVDVDALADRAGDDVVMVYAENPTVRGCIEERLGAIGDLAADADALFTLGSDPVSLSVLEEPASVGADVVVGEAGALGLPTAYGMGLGLFACSDDFLRQVPGRLVGAAEENGEEVHVGPIVSDDAFYNESDEYVDDWEDANLLAIEMEAATVFSLARRKGLRAGAICTVDGNLVAGTQKGADSDDELPEKAKDNVERAIRITLNAVTEL